MLASRLISSFKIRLIPKEILRRPPAIFVQNTIDPEGNIEKTTSNAGSDSPFRTVNFSGLVGSEISYRLGERYRLGVNPGIRYPFSSIYKEDIGLESTPVTFDVGVRFRYIFR